MARLLKFSSTKTLLNGNQLNTRKKMLNTISPGNRKEKERERKKEKEEEEEKEIKAKEDGIRG